MNKTTENKPIVINIVSGKGGTGKTLLSAVLADMLGNQDTMTLVIDLDIFVRGLTTLLYFHKKESILLIEKSELSVSDYFIKANSEEINLREANLGISRYRSFDVLPSVSRVDELIDFRDLSPDSREQAINQLKKLLKDIPNKYKIIILDSRAGYDELISATHFVSDVTICVQEDDVVSRITSDNLFRQLESDSKTPLFRVTNKARGIQNLNDLDKKSKEGITDLGVIPFDMDVMNSFGANNFWEVISRSLYKSALVRAWNGLNRKMNFGFEITEHRMSPVVSEILEKRMGILSSKERIIFLYGIILAVVGISYGIVGDSIREILLKDPTRFMSLIIGILGLVMAIFSTTLFRKR
ncbi:MAG: ParA family protein [Anaerolineaceae bacterium]|nr:MAG: ParA family protein [Anaerolineaceae bacterium]